MPFKAIIETLAQKTAENSTINDSDYVKDGLLYCGKCHGPKQTRIVFLGEEKTPYCTCRCEEEIYRQLDKIKYQREYEIETERLRSIAFPSCQELPPDYPPTENMRNWTFANDNNSNPQIMEIARQYAENFEECFKEGVGFLYYGNMGAGKSYIAACIANALVERHYPVLMTTFARIRTEVQGTKEKQAVFDRLNKVSLLIIDDLAIESDSGYMNEIVFETINNRINANLPIIVTTNLTQEEMSKPKENRYKRLFSRINGCCQPIKFNGPDLRRNKVNEKLAKMRKILNIGG